MTKFTSTIPVGLMTGMKFGPDTADWLLGLPRLAVQATRLLRSALRSRAQTGSRALSIWMMDKESCTGDLPVPNLPQVHDGKTVGDDAALGLLAIASSIAMKGQPVGNTRPQRASTWATVENAS